MSDNYKRIKIIRVIPVSGNVVAEIEYSDGKSASFLVDRGKLNDKELLKETFDSIFKQLEATQ